MPSAGPSDDVGVDAATLAKVEEIMEDTLEWVRASGMLFDAAGGRWMHRWAPKVLEALRVLCPPENRRYHGMWEDRPRPPFTPAPAHQHRLVDCFICLKPGVRVPPFARSIILPKLGVPWDLARKRLSVYFFQDLWKMALHGSRLGVADDLVPARTHWQAWRAVRDATAAAPASVPPTGSSTSTPSSSSSAPPPQPQTITPGPPPKTYDFRAREEIQQPLIFEPPPAPLPKKKPGKSSSRGGKKSKNTKGAWGNDDRRASQYM
jgi:hypothetical protein